MKTSKQFPRWVKKAGLKLSYSSSLARKYECFYFKGHGRHWRIDCEGNLDMSETFDTFDRWANSREASMKMNATNEKEFVKLVKELLILGAMVKQLKRKE